MKGRIQAICISPRRGEVKHAVDRVELRADFGIVGDGHGGDELRQVSLLAAEAIAAVKAELPDLAAGAFGENLVTEGCDLAVLKLEDRLRLGEDIVLEVTQLGKECHTPCAIGLATGDCIMPRSGVFCRVVKGGVLHPGADLDLAP